MTWLNLLENPNQIQSMYSKIPFLDNVQIMELRLHENGPTLFLRCNFNEFPDLPPKKWLQAGFNRVQITIGLIGISSISISGWQSTNMASISLNFLNNELHCLITGETLHVECISGHGYIDDVSAYRDSRLFK